MKVIVKGRHVNLTPSLKAHAEDKLGKAFMRIFDRPAVQLEIELGERAQTKDGVNKECRVTAFMPKGKTINIHEVADDMYKAIDLAHDRLMEQVKRQRSKKRDTTRDKKSAEAARAKEARDGMTTSPEKWEEEVEEFESSTAEA